MALRTRLLAASLLLVALGLLAADVVTYRALRAFLHTRLDEQLAAADRSVHRALSGRLARAQLEQLATAVPGVYIQLRELDGTVVYDSFAVNERLGAQRPALPDELVPLVRPLAVDPRPAHLLTVPSEQRGGPRYRVRVSPLARVGVVVVALPLDDIDATLQRLVLIEVLVTAGVLVAAGALGLWLVRLGLRPLTDIERTAATITAGGLGHRVVRSDERTEVGRLGRALNVMLDRIDAAFAERRASEQAARRSEQRMRRFVADASHELRTPVAAVRAYAELYRLGADERPEDLARVLSRIEHEAVRMGALVDDLLLLTRLDEGRPLERAVVDLGAVAAEAVDAARAVEPDRPLDLTVDGSVEVLGDRDRLRQVADNLLANVRAHTPAGAPARVRVRAAGRHALLEVADSGPGLAGEDTARLFERFYRSDPGRSRDRGGAGLGLSIVAAIAAAHGGTASAGSGPAGGAVFRVSLPILDDTAPVVPGDEGPGQLS